MADSLRAMKVVLTLIAGLFLLACIQNSREVLTSTSVTTGNPSGIRIIFKKDSTPISLNGVVEVFASTQIPVPGFSPKPLLRIELAEAKDIEIATSSINSIPDSLWPEKSTEGDSIQRFNAVITSDSLGLILENICFNRKKAGFSFSKEDSVLPSNNSQAEIIANLAQLTDYAGKTDTNQLSAFHDYYLFIYGTGFVSKGEHGIFMLPRLPIGTHNAFFLPLAKKPYPVSSIDSATIFSLNGKLDTRTDSLSRGPIYREIELPDSLKTGS